MKEFGTLLVKVSATQAEIPIQGASVVLTDQLEIGEKYTLLFFGITNQSGETGIMRISAPDLRESQHPAGGEPFSTCDIWVEHPDYVPALIENVQVFPAVETVQNVRLLPLAEWDPGTGQLEVNRVTAQPL